jgi:hypothetical protein
MCSCADASSALVRAWHSRQIGLDGQEDYVWSDTGGQAARQFRQGGRQTFLSVKYSAAIIPHLLSERPMRAPCLGVDNLVKTCARSRSQEIDSKSWGGSVPKSLQCRAFQARIA